LAIVAGVDFGTLSVRVTLLGSVNGRLGTASAAYPLHRRPADPDFATQSRTDHMLDPLLDGVRDKIGGKYATSDEINLEITNA